MVKDKSGKKKEAPVLTEAQEDVEMEDVAPEKVCYIHASHNIFYSCFNCWFSSS